MNLREELIEGFQIFDSKLTTAVLSKCEDLCNTYNITAEDLANQWAAYSVTHLYGSAPTVDDLLSMERKELSKSNRDVAGSSKSVTTPKSARISRDEPIDITDSNGITGTSTPKSVRTTKRVCSPIDRTPKRFQAADNVIINLSPQLSQSPSINKNSSLSQAQAADYSERTDSGTVILSYGSQNLLHKSQFRCEDKDMYAVQIRKWPEGHPSLNSNVHYMYEVMNAKANSLNNMTENLGQYLLKKYVLAEPTPFVKSSSSIVSYGRICCDLDGKLNAASVLLESSRELSRGATIPLNLSKLQSYAIFPGQVVAVEGFNPTGNNFVVQKLYSDASPALSLPSDHRLTFKEPLHIIVAAAPFTLHDNLEYQPLKDLLTYVQNNRPHVVILVGPFLDETHGAAFSECDMTEPFNVFFQALVDCLMAPLEGSNTQVVLVPSQKDAHHHCVFPTPPYEIRKKYTNLHFTSDPSLLNIEGLIVGVTSVDVLLHLGKEELSLCTGGDRMSRLASHLFSQQSFYPLYPPDDDMAIDHELLEQYGILDVIPHILLVPSNLRYFIKQIGGCTVINPERLVKGYVGGTFVQIQVHPPKENSALNDNIVAKIVRI